MRRCPSHQLLNRNGVALITIGKEFVDEP